MPITASRIIGQCLFRLMTKKHERSALLSVCEENPPVSRGFPAKRDSNMENVSISKISGLYSKKANTLLINSLHRGRSERNFR